MTKDEALRLALEALENIDRAMPFPVAKLAIKECKAALETKDEPVAWMSEDEHTVYTSKQVDGCFQHDHIPLYTTPQRTWVGLTDEERIDIAYDAKRDEVVAVKLTEAKLRSKNT